MAHGGVEFRVLGPIEVGRDGTSIDVGGPRQRRLLALLLLTPGHLVSVDTLVDEIWSTQPPDGAATTIRSYVSRLRSALGPDVPITGSAAGYTLGAADDRIDAVRFEQLIRSAESDGRQGNVRQAGERLKEALALWRGRPFADLGDDGLLRIEADRLEELRLNAVEQRFESEITLGRGPELTDELEAMVGQHPYRERLWSQLMLALYQAGRQADALAAYRRARAMLDEHLGLDPSPELQALEQQILRHEVPAVVKHGQVAGLPAELSRFVGRELELGQLVELLRTHRLVTLTGVGGVGKTRLATEAARRAGELAPDGVAFIDLATVSEPAGVARAAARAFGMRERSGLGALEQLAIGLTHSRSLLLFDNCEHVVEAAAQVAQAVLGACPEVRLLATSRTPLGCPGETEFAVLPLAMPATDTDIDELRRSDAVQLLVDRVAAAGARLPDDEAALLHAARICRDLDGIPLAIELAAARAKILSLNDIASRLDDRFRFLVSWRRVASGRHQTLRQAMDWSYDLLAEAEQAALERLSVFVGGFDVPSAAAVCAGGDEAKTLDLLTRLVDASLVIAETARPDSRFRMLETVRQYGSARLGEHGGRAEAGTAHATYFAALAQQAEPELTGAEQTAWFTRLDVEHDNILAALSWMADSAASDDQRTVRLLKVTVSLTRFWYVRGHLAEARQWLELASSTADHAPASLRRRALTATASVALLQGDYIAAGASAEQSLAAAHETGEQRLIANGLSNLGAILLAAGEHERSGAVLGQAVDLARTVDDDRILAMALNNLGDHALTVGDGARAKPLLEESLFLLRERGDTANVARSLFNLGAVALELGEHADAQLRFRESLAASRQAGDKEDMCWCLLGLAGLSARRGDDERAATLLGAADALLSAMGAAFKPFERSLHDRTASRAHAALGDARYSAARERGATMMLEAALEYASAA